MIKITLPDGSVRELEDGASPLDLALGISKSLAMNELSLTIERCQQYINFLSPNNISGHFFQT